MRTRQRVDTVHLDETQIRQHARQIAARGWTRLRPQQQVSIQEQPACIGICQQGRIHAGRLDTWGKTAIEQRRADCLPPSGRPGRW